MVQARDWWISTQYYTDWLAKRRWTVLYAVGIAWMRIFLCTDEQFFAIQNQPCYVWCQRRRGKGVFAECWNSARKHLDGDIRELASYVTERVGCTWRVITDVTCATWLMSAGDGPPTMHSTPQRACQSHSHYVTNTLQDWINRSAIRPSIPTFSVYVINWYAILTFFSSSHYVLSVYDASNCNDSSAWYECMSTNSAVRRRVTTTYILKYCSNTLIQCVSLDTAQRHSL